MGIDGLPENFFRANEWSFSLEVQIVLADHVVYAARSDS